MAGPGWTELPEKLRTVVVGEGGGVLGDALDGMAAFAAGGVELRREETDSSSSASVMSTGIDSGSSLLTRISISSLPRAPLPTRWFLADGGAENGSRVGRLKRGGSTFSMSDASSSWLRPRNAFEKDLRGTKKPPLDWVSFGGRGGRGRAADEGNMRPRKPALDSSRRPAGLVESPPSSCARAGTAKNAAPQTTANPKRVPNLR